MSVTLMDIEYKNGASVKLAANMLFEEHGEKAIDVINRKIFNFNNKHSKDRDFWYRVLTEIEKLSNKDIV